jgi:hypothetical protein
MLLRLPSIPALTSSVYHTSMGLRGSSHTLTAKLETQRVMIKRWRASYDVTTYLKLGLPRRSERYENYGILTLNLTTTRMGGYAVRMILEAPSRVGYLARRQSSVQALTCKTYTHDSRGL